MGRVKVARGAVAGGAVAVIYDSRLEVRKNSRLVIVGDHRTLGELLEPHPDIEIVALTSFVEEERVIAAIEAALSSMSRAAVLSSISEELQSSVKLKPPKICSRWSRLGVSPHRVRRITESIPSAPMARSTSPTGTTRAPAVTPETAKRWLDQGHDDEGRPVVTLDTRNQFEVDAGTFKNTINWGITKFTEFPDAVQAHLDELQDKTVISFCTGGIRCEKAAIYMRNAGLPHVYQLEGGILKYFEEVGSDHYDGGCFVFDERRAVGADLSATGLTPEGTFPVTAPTAPTPLT